MVDAAVSNTADASRVGSSPIPGTNCSLGYSVFSLEGSAPSNFQLFAPIIAG